MDTKAQFPKAPAVEGDRNYPEDLEAHRGAEEWMEDPAIFEAWIQFSRRSDRIELART